MSYENLLIETRGRIGIIRLNRPQALNALNSALNAELARAVAGFDADAGIGCILITGSEKAFAAGADIKEMANLSPDAANAFGRLGHAVMHAAEAMPQPVIAAVNGYAYGGGLELALSCDIRLASTTASFAAAEIKLGWIGGGGLVSRVCSPDSLMAAARSLASVIAARSMGLEQAIQYEREMQAICMGTRDAAEGRSAFAEKRSPRFTGH
jgi:enoyl-CoA hydratase/carnithine racemase